MAAGLNPWFLGSAPAASAKLRLFCFPYAGAGASIFHGWQAALPEGVAVCAMQPPGRENRLREPAFTAMGPLVEAAVQAIRPFLIPPFAFFGHSLGALVAYEIAARLHRDGAPGVALFVSGCRAPRLQRLPKRPLHRLLPEEFVAELRRLKGSPEGVLANKELLDLLLPTLRADFAILETYLEKAENNITSPIVAFGGQDDPQVKPEELAVWARQSTGEFRMQLFPGGHFFLRGARANLLAALAGDLKSIQDADPTRHPAK